MRGETPPVAWHPRFPGLEHVTAQIEHTWCWVQVHQARAGSCPASPSVTLSSQIPASMVSPTSLPAVSLDTLAYLLKQPVQLRQQLLLNLCLSVTCSCTDLKFVLQQPVSRQHPSATEVPRSGPGQQHNLLNAFSTVQGGQTCAAGAGLVEVQGYHLVTGDVPVADVWVLPPQGRDVGYPQRAAAVPLTVVFASPLAGPSVRTLRALVTVPASGAAMSCSVDLARCTHQGLHVVLRDPQCSQPDDHPLAAHLDVSMRCPGCCASP